MIYVDMNRSGSRDKRETMTEAWRRLDLLEPDETFSRGKYVACVQRTVEALKKGNLLTEKGAALYLEEARVKQFPSS
jgi:hypothetical protein